MIVPLSELSIKSIPNAGGKAANLGELIKAGFNVPQGICVTTEAFTYFQKNKKLPPEFVKKLKLEISKLKGPFAVRSSATTEDLAKASFAGQHDTYLNVKKEKIPEAIKKCFYSLYTERAVAYRKHNKIPESRAKMAVIVQEMVNADYSGVCFTLDPVNKKTILIEIVKGLGEKLVSGKATPNTYFLDRKNFRIVDKSEQFKANLDLKAAAKTAISIEKHYRRPMDIEFAIKKGKLHILQARPVTT